METKEAKFWLWMAFMLVIFVFMDYSFSLMHESAHSAVCTAFGGTSENTVNLFSQSYSTCFNVNTTQEFNLAQANVESFGYQLYAMMMTLFLIITLSILFVLW